MILEMVLGVLCVTLAVVGVFVGIMLILKKLVVKDSDKTE